MERCERYTQLLSARMDGELAPQERQVTVMVPLPRGTRSCWPQLGHLK